ALKNEVLNLGCLFGHLIFGGGEWVSSGDDPGLYRRPRHLVPAPQHGLAPGIAGIIVGKRDFLVFGVGNSLAGGKERGERHSASKCLLEHLNPPIKSREKRPVVSGPN